MPIYEYQCEDCGHALEALQKMADAPLRDCPECSAPRLRRLISAPSFRLKGGGWYETDFKTGGRKNVVSDEAGGSKPGAGKDAGADKAGKTGKESKKESSGTAATKTSGGDKSCAA